VIALIASLMMLVAADANNCTSGATFIFEDNRLAVHKQQKQMLKAISELREYKNNTEAMWLKGTLEDDSRKALEAAVKGPFCRVIYFGYSFPHLVPEYARRSPQKIFFVIDSPVADPEIWQLRFDNSEIVKSALDQIEELGLVPHRKVGAIWGGPSPNVLEISNALRAECQKRNLKLLEFKNSDTPIWGRGDIASKQMNDLKSFGADVVFGGAADADLEIEKTAQRHSLKSVFIDGPATDFCLKFEKQSTKSLVEILRNWGKQPPPTKVMKGQWLLIHGDSAYCRPPKKVSSLSGD